VCCHARGLRHTPTADGNHLPMGDHIEASPSWSSAGNVFLWDRLAKAAPNLPAAFLGDFLRPVAASTNATGAAPRTGGTPVEQATSRRHGRRSRYRAGPADNRSGHCLSTKCSAKYMIFFRVMTETAHQGCTVFLPLQITKPPTPSLSQVCWARRAAGCSHGRRGSSSPGCAGRRRRSRPAAHGGRPGLPWWAFCNARHRVKRSVHAVHVSC
jgi:hypothetical protein